MKIAFTLDDLPLWPMSYPPAGYTVAGIAKAISRALAEQGIREVYAFCNSWPLETHPEFARILDDWVAAGHHVANHTHGHVQLPDVSAEDFIRDIDRAEEALAPWLARAPRKLFRAPLCHWGETPEKLGLVKAHLARAGLVAVDVTTWAYEWTWNRAWRNALDRRDLAAQTFIRESFLDFSVAQIRHDHAGLQARFGAGAIAIALGHPVPFFADVAAEWFERLTRAGVVFVPLQEALDQPMQASVGSVVSSEFAVLPRKLALAEGCDLAAIPPEQRVTFERIVAMGRGQTG